MRAPTTFGVTTAPLMPTPSWSRLADNLLPARGHPRRRLCSAQLQHTAPETTLSGCTNFPEETRSFPRTPWEERAPVSPTCLASSENAQSRFPRKTLDKEAPLESAQRDEDPGIERSHHWTFGALRLPSFHQSGNLLHRATPGTEENACAQRNRFPP